MSRSWRNDSRLESKAERKLAKEIRNMRKSKDNRNGVYE